MLNNDQVIYKLPTGLDILPILLKLDDYTTYYGFVIEQSLSRFVRLDLSEEAEDYICHNCKFKKRYEELLTEKIDKIHKDHVNKFFKLIEDNITPINKNIEDFNKKKSLDIIGKNLYIDKKGYTYLHINEDKFILLNDLFSLEEIKDIVFLRDYNDITTYFMALFHFSSYFFTLESIFKVDHLKEELENILKEYEDELEKNSDVLDQMENEGKICTKQVYPIYESCLLKDSNLPLEENMCIKPIKDLDKILNTLTLIRPINLKNYCFLKRCSPSEINVIPRTRLYLRVEDELRLFESQELTYDNVICWGDIQVDNFLDMKEIIDNYLNLSFPFSHDPSIQFQINDKYDFLKIGLNTEEIVLKNYRGDEVIFDLNNNLFNPYYKPYGFLLSIRDCTVDLLYTDENSDNLFTI